MQKFVVSLHVIGLPLGVDRFSQTQRRGKSIGNRPRDLVLNGEDIVELAIEVLRPEMKPVCGAHQLGGDPQVLSGFTHTAFQDMRDSQLRSDLPQIGVLAFENERRSPARNSYPADLREAIENFLG